MELGLGARTGTGLGWGWTADGGVLCGVVWCYCLLASGLEQGVSDAVCVCVRVIDFELITGCMH